MSIQTLIDQTYSYFVEAVDDLKDLYKSDYEDFITVERLLATDKTAAYMFVSEMDTEAREAVLTSLIEDYGVKWVENNFNVKVI